MNKDLRCLQNIIEYDFSDEGLLKQALIHPSYSGEMNMTRNESNQRLEFLGDAVLELIVSDYLYKNHPDEEEGELTRIRSSLVFERALYKCASEIGLGEFVYLGKGEENQGGRNKSSILADTFEAVIGSVYLDGGQEAARDFIYKFLLNKVDELVLLRDGKSFIQEYVQQDQNSSYNYITRENDTDDSLRKFVSELYIDNELIASGFGRSKKTAEQAAAIAAIKKLGIGK